MGVVGRTTLSDQVADAVIALIQARGLREGEALPPTSELAQEFDVSRPVVREALAELAGRGLLKRQQGREGVFTLPGSRQLSQLLALRLAHRHIALTDLQEFRETVEVGAARLAAQRVASGELDGQRLRECLQALEGARGEAAMHEADLALHQAVAEASGNDVFVLVLDSLTPLLRESRATAWAGYVRTGGDTRRAVALHTDLVDRVLAGDPDGAAEAMARDLADTRSAIAVVTSPTGHHEPGAPVAPR